MRQAVYGRLAGYEDVNDAERLARGPAMRAIVGREGLDGPAASTSEMGRFETEWLSTEANLAALAALSGTWIDRVHGRRPPDGIILDMDSSESPTYGGQEGSAWNGHFRCSCYHPLFLFNQFGDLERCLLRPGNVHGADEWRSVLVSVIARYRGRGLVLYLRGDAAFAKPELYDLLEAESIGYAIRLPANLVLQERIGHLLTRPVGRLPRKPRVLYASFTYQAQSWAKPRRVVAKVEWHQGELHPRVGFIVTNRIRPAGIASGLGPSSSLQLASAARHAFGLTNGRPRSSFSGANRPIWGTSGELAACVRPGSHRSVMSVCSCCCHRGTKIEGLRGDGHEKNFAHLSSIHSPFSNPFGFLRSSIGTGLRH